MGFSSLPVSVPEGRSLKDRSKRHGLTTGFFYTAQQRAVLRTSLAVRMFLKSALMASAVDGIHVLMELSSTSAFKAAKGTGSTELQHILIRNPQIQEPQKQCW